jgi:hypothetical protein
MKRILTVGFIVAYLGTLNYGVLCHMMGFGTAAHPLMYFIVWDMFCGYSAYDSRVYVIAEGENQKFYDLAAPPWGEFKPWGEQGRQHYDVLNNHTARIGFNTLRHTQHEPITRMFVIEENWAKKYNMPDGVWSARFDGPKDIKKYYRVRTILLPDGTVTENVGTWLNFQSVQMVNDNPRLQAQASRSRTFFMIDNDRPGREMMITPASGGNFPGSAGPMVGAPLGN